MNYADRLKLASLMYQTKGEYTKKEKIWLMRALKQGVKEVEKEKAPFYDEKTSDEVLILLDKAEKNIAKE